MLRERCPWCNRLVAVMKVGDKKRCVKHRVKRGGKHGFPVCSGAPA